jgi:2-polyprenyl-6-methoxyphenol hydroxylase-like FAD-dependent oxidoreductase
MAKPFKHAAVLGSGMAGLVSARVLADFFDKVTVFEKDPQPDGPGFRPGIPQGRHFHALIPGGLDIMSDLLPGIKDELRAAGSILPRGDQFYTYLPEGKSYAQGRYVPNPPPDDGNPMYVQTRGLLEHCIRTRVMALPNVDARYNCPVKDLLSDDGNVTGIVVDGTGEEVHADLVVDALGKAGRTLHWLDKLGFERPREDVVNCDFAYTSVFMKPDSADLFTDVGFFVAPNVEAGFPPRGAALVRMEDGSWLALVGGRYGDYPPRDFEGFMAYAETISEPVFLELIKQATPVGEPAHFRFPKGIRRRFDELSQFPEGLLPVGDSVCHFNPTYGQGMTSACRQAIGLQRTLQSTVAEGSDLTGIWQKVMPVSYQETRAPWLFATMADFAHPQCTGDFPVEETETLAVYQYVMEQAMKGDREAGGIARSLATLQMPLEELDNSEWPARFAQSKAEEEADA